MKVESVRAYPLRVKMEQNLQGGTFAYQDYQTVLVEAVCDGVGGWGEAMSRSDPRINALASEYLGATLEGGEFQTVGEAWGILWQQLRVRGHTRGPFVEALSGIETALTDCMAKLGRMPVSRLLSPSSSRRVPAFAGSVMKSRGPLQDQVELVRSAGLSGVKVKVGFGVERDLEVLREIRRAWEDGVLVADANGAYDSAAAAKACAAFREVGLSWFEEPVLSDDLDGYRSLKASGVRIGAGESWFPGDFELPVQEGLVGVLEPSVSRCGGVGVEADLARRASKAGIAFSPMTGMNSAVSLAASLQVAAAFPCEGVELNPFPNPLLSELAEGLPEPREGGVVVPEGPGLGIEVDRKFLKAHLLE